MACSHALEARRNADCRFTFKPDGIFSFAGTTPLVSIRRGTASLLAIGMTPTVNGSVVTLDGDDIVLTIKRADLALLDSPESDLKSEDLFYDITLTDSSGLTSWLLGGEFILLGLNDDASCAGSGTVNVFIDGRCIMVSVSGVISTGGGGGIPGPPGPPGPPVDTSTLANVDASNINPDVWRDVLDLPVEVTLASLAAGAATPLPMGAYVTIVGRVTPYDRPDRIQCRIQSTVSYANDGWYSENGEYVVALPDGRLAVSRRAPRSLITLPDSAYWGNGVVDVAPLLNKLLISAEDAAVVLPPPSVAYRCGETVSVPIGRSLVMVQEATRTSVYRGNKMVFDRDVMHCVDALGHPLAGNIPSVLKGLYITRELPYATSGAQLPIDTVAKILEQRAAIPTGSTGLRMGLMAQAVVEDVFITGHDVGLQWPKTVDGVVNNGLGTSYNRVNTGCIKTTHVDLNAAVEHRFNQCRFGINGQFDIKARQYLSFGRPNSSTPNGVDSPIFVNCQFNEGNSTGSSEPPADPNGVISVQRVIYLDDYSDTDGTVTFSACHFEHYKHFAEASAGSPVGLRRVLVDSCTAIGNGTSAIYTNQQLVNLSGVQLDDFRISNSFMVGSWIFTNPYDVALTGNKLVGANFTFNGAYTLSVTGNTIEGGTTLDGHFEVGAITGNSFKPFGSPGMVDLGYTGNLSIVANSYDANYGGAIWFRSPGVSIPGVVETASINEVKSATSSAYELIAHRGFATSGAVQNTIASLSSAIAAGANSLEMDWQITSDGVGVLFHDPTLDALTNGTGTIKSQTAAVVTGLHYDIAQATGSVFGTTLTIPRFSEALAVIKDAGCRAYVEIKDFRTTADINLLIDSIVAGNVIDSVDVSSFTLAHIQQVRAYNKRVSVSYLTGDLSNYATLINTLASLRPVGVIADRTTILANQACVNAFKSAGIPLAAYTVTNSAQADELKSIGVNRIISDVVA